MVTLTESPAIGRPQEPAERGGISLATRANVWDQLYMINELAKHAAWVIMSCVSHTQM
jgi:hypothetical protein